MACLTMGGAPTSNSLASAPAVTHPSTAPTSATNPARVLPSALAPTLATAPPPAPASTVALTQAALSRMGTRPAYEAPMTLHAAKITPMHYPPAHAWTTTTTATTMTTMSQLGRNLLSIFVETPTLLRAVLDRLLAPGSPSSPHPTTGQLVRCMTTDQVPFSTDLSAHLSAHHRTNVDPPLGQSSTSRSHIGRWTVTRSALARRSSSPHRRRLEALMWSCPTPTCQQRFLFPITPCLLSCL